MEGELARAAITRGPEKTDALGCIPYFRNMRVMVTENLAMQHGAVNGQEGDLIHVVLEEGLSNMVHAKCAFVRIDTAGQVCDGLPVGVVPIFPVRTTHEFYSSFAQRRVKFTREQLPLLPAYVYTDYKSQGRSLETAIVDVASANKLQGMYVMLSRVRSLRGLAVLRPFTSTLFSRSLPHHHKDEFDRLAAQDEETRRWIDNVFGIETAV